MSEDLVDKIVEDEALGIKKKPSLVKIVSVALVLLIAGLMGYSIFMKSNQVEEQPTLDIVSTQQINKTNPAVAESNIQPPSPSAPSQNPQPNATVIQANQVNPTQDNLVIGQLQPATNQQQALPQSQQVQQSPVNSTQVLPSQQSQAPVAVPIQPAPLINPTSPSNATNSNQLLDANITQNETQATLSEQPKKIIKHKRKKVAPKKGPAEDVKPEPQPMEEGVTREEIIVIQ